MTSIGNDTVTKVAHVHGPDRGQNHRTISLAIGIVTVAVPAVTITKKQISTEMNHPATVAIMNLSPEVFCPVTVGFRNQNQKKKKKIHKISKLLFF